MVNDDEIERHIRGKAMTSPEWAVAYGLLEVAHGLRFVGNIIAGPSDDFAGINRIGAELGRIADVMHGHQTGAERAIEKSQKVDGDGGRT